MLQRIQNFCRACLAGRLKRHAGAAGLLAKPVEEHFDSWEQRLQNTLRSISACPCRIRLAKQEDGPEILQLVQQNLLHHEPLLRTLNIRQTPASGQLVEYIGQQLREGFTLVAQDERARIVGAAIGKRSCQWDGKQLLERADRTQCNQLRKLFYIWSIVEAEPNLHQHFCTHCLYEIAFLVTAVDSQRQGIGLHLTLHSLQLARQLGFQFARMNCTCEYSARIATKAGLECHWTVAYHHLVDSTQQPVVRPESPHTHIKVHATSLFPGCPLNPHAGRP
uniref:N-acetyltransferase domain-containing protein n=1 Tax=Anopheles atroparvus TaxID=41427 RepID=A0AAG5DPA5_ANOAO